MERLPGRMAWTATSRASNPIGLGLAFDYNTMHISTSVVTSTMEQKTARLTVLIDPAKKKAFEALCAKEDVTPSQVVRRLIREYLAAHGVSFIPGGTEETRP